MTKCQQVTDIRTIATCVVTIGYPATVPLWIDHFMRMVIRTPLSIPQKEGITRSDDSNFCSPLLVQDSNG